tara:strand:- start:20 stop:337 length:318 start_codon:yes stop_codon:yes gene_type:complete
MILTLVSTLGGGIRYRENFMDEILDDMYEEVGDLTTNVMNTLYKLVPGEESIQEESIQEESIIPKKNIQGILKTKLQQPKPTDHMGSDYAPLVIEAFDGNVYSNF